MKKKYRPTVEALKAYRAYVSQHGPYDLKQYPFVVPGDTHRYGDLAIEFDGAGYRLISERGGLDEPISIHG